MTITRKPKYVEGEEEEEEEEEDIVFHCSHCEVSIVQNSREHDDCITTNDIDWFCGDCHDFCEEVEEEAGFIISNLIQTFKPK
jgi:hypothetical protein